MKKQAYNQTTFGERLLTTSRYLQRAKRHGSRQFASALLAPQTWLHLTPNRPLNGLGLYSQSLHQLAQHSRDYYRLPERTSMVVHYRH